MTITIGIDVGGTKLLATRLEDGAVVAQEHFTTPGEATELTAGTLAAIHEVWVDGVDAVGAGVAGLVQYPEGIFVWGPHVAGTDVRLRAELEAELAVPVVVDNDANTGAWAELHRGAGRGYDDLLLVTLGSGIGGAIVIGGEIYRGSTFAGEWGHMLYQEHGLLCDCGKQGCWETVASGPALVRLAREFITLNPDGQLAHRLRGEALSGEAVTRAADAGDEAARGLVAQVGAALGRGLCSLIAILDPQIVVVGGGLGSIGESLLGPARRVAADALHGGAHRTLPPILVADLGPAAGAIGAALLAEERLKGRLVLD